MPDCQDESDFGLEQKILGKSLIWGSFWDTNVLLLVFGLNSKSKIRNFYLIGSIERCISDPEALAKGYEIFVEFYKHKHFWIVLIRIICQSDLDFRCKQLAILVLKNWIIDWWTDENFPERTMTIENLFSIIGRKEVFFRKQIAEIIGTIICYESPNLNQELVNFLTESLVENGLISEDENRVDGALRSLISIFTKCSEKISVLVPLILNPLYEWYFIHEDHKIRLKWLKLWKLCLLKYVWMEDIDDARLNELLSKDSIDKWILLATEITTGTPYNLASVTNLKEVCDNKEKAMSLLIFIYGELNSLVFG